MTTRIAILGIASALLLAGGAARAANDDTAILPAEASGKVPVRYLQRIDKSVAVHAGGARMVTPAERKESKQTGCLANPECWAQVGKGLLAHRLLAITVEPVGDSFSVDAVLVDVDEAKLIGERKRTLAHDALATAPGKMVEEILWQAPRGAPVAAAPAAGAEKVEASRQPPATATPTPTATVARAEANRTSPPASEATLSPTFDDKAQPAPVAAGTTEVVAAAPGHDRRLEPNALLGARVGLLIPQAFNKLTTNFLVEVEAAYQLPFFHKRLGLFFDVGYQQPDETGQHTADPRVMSNGGTVTYNMKVQDLSFALGVQYRHAIGRWVVPYAGVGAVLHLTKTTVDQQAGTVDLGENTQQNTRFGFLGRLGLGVHLGPGDLIVEVHVDYTPVDHLITGDNNTGHLGLHLGYLFRI